MNYFEEINGGLVFREDGETVMVSPWGVNSLRVRSCILGEITEGQGALLPPETDPEAAKVCIGGSRAEIANGEIRAELSVQEWGKALQITFRNSRGEILLQEIPNGGALQKKARQFKPLPGGAFSLRASFVSNPDEKIYGMGQYQQERMDLKGCTNL